MPTVVLQPGSTIFVTGVNGLVGSHVADQLLTKGYHVRGAVRDVEKSRWLVEYFAGKNQEGKFELVSVPDMTVDGCYDELVKGMFPRHFLSSTESSLATAALRKYNMAS